MPLDVEDHFEIALREQRKREAAARARQKFADDLVGMMQPDFKETLHYFVISYTNEADEYLFYFGRARGWLTKRWVRKHAVLQVIDYRAKTQKYQFILAVFSSSNKQAAENLAGRLALVYRAEPMKLYVTQKPRSV